MTEKDPKPTSEESKKKDKVEVDTVPIETDQTAEEQYHNYDDDEFEEFPAHEELLDLPTEETNDVNVWEDNWEDENVEQDFYKQLREELQSVGKRI
ncbi:unnamed protein product [Bursaphelenchus xylophilus]|uniref:26S proteasome complex subunit dss-1 n=1 Tax=Bursaphelenchus xylophilus TaxID=6326 RepID=A0A1I7RZI8_BURXY|nr:unnamed protein product [Bursaphelenchus xylophilus]CAG9111284.1 unnamed protein product [Bursaphelenchus xylophilus]